MSVKTSRSAAAWIAVSVLCLISVYGCKSGTKTKHGQTVAAATLTVSDFSHVLPGMGDQGAEASISYSVPQNPPQGGWNGFWIDAEITGDAAPYITQILDESGDDFDMEWDYEYGKWTGGAQQGPLYLSGTSLFVVHAQEPPSAKTGHVKATFKYQWHIPPPPPDRYANETITIEYDFTLKPSPGKKTSSQGLGGVTLSIDDWSGFDGWSNLTEIPSTLTVNVPSGTTISNVVVTAKIETTNDVVAEPYADSPSGDFQMDWTKLDGDPKWGWEGTESLGTISASKTSNILIDLGTISSADTASVQAKVEYTYEGQNDSLEVSYNVDLIP